MVEKKVYSQMLLFALSILWSLGTNFAQTSLHIKGGLNFANMVDLKPTTDVTSTLKIGFNAGIAIKSDMTSKIYLSPSFQFSSKGQSFLLLANRKVNYLEIPIHIGYQITETDKRTVSIFTGPYVGLATSAKSITSALFNKKVTILNIGNNPAHDWIRPWEFGFSIGADVQMNKSSCGVQFSHSINNLSPDFKNNAILKNKVLNIYYCYQIGEKIKLNSFRINSLH